MTEALIVLALIGVLIVAFQLLGGGADSAAVVRLTFPRTVKADQVLAAARSLAGLLPPWWRFTPAPSVTLDVRATAEGVRHVLTMHASRAEYVTGSLRAAIPGLRVDDESTEPTGSLTLARELQARGEGELRTDTIASGNAGILASLQPLGSNERAVLQYVITPTATNPLAKAAARWIASWRGDEAEPEPVEPQFAVAIRAAVAAPSAPRSRQLIARLLGSFHALNGPEARLVRRLLPSPVVADRIERMSPGRSIIGADELAAAWAVPVEAPELPGLTLANSRELPPAANVPRRGLVLGDSTLAGSSRPVAVTQAEARRGLHVCAPTGAGKSTILTGLAVQLMAARSRPGLIVIDSKGDLIADLADRIPAERRRDVIVFDPTDSEPVGFNLIGGSGESDLIVDHVVSELRARYGAAGLGPRSEDILRACLTTLTARGGFTLCEVEPLLTNPAFRQKLVGGLDEPILEGFWAWYGSLSPAAQGEAIAPLANKLRTYTLRRRVRAVIGQADGLDLGAALEDGKVVLVNLAKGLLGKDAAALIGAAMVSRLWTAIQARAALSPKDRRPATVIADEFQDLAALSPVFSEAVAQSRGYKVGWVLAHQHLAQLDPETRQAVLANCRSRSSCRRPPPTRPPSPASSPPTSKRPTSKGSGPLRAMRPSRLARPSRPRRASAPVRLPIRSARPGRSAPPPASATARAPLTSMPRSGSASKAPARPLRSASDGGPHDSARTSFRVCEARAHRKLGCHARLGSRNDYPAPNEEGIVTRRYASKKRLAHLEETLTPRERAIIDTLDRLRVATTEQLRRIHFADLTPRSAARQAPALLRSLAARQVVVKLERQVGGVRSGSRAAVWSLDTIGQRLASSCGPAGGFHRRRPWTPSLSFLAHRLAVSEVFAALTEREQAGAVEVLDFDAEPLSWRRYVSAHGATAYLKPDAFVRLGVGEFERAAFVEIDRDTESRSTLTVKLRAYRQYWETGREQERRGYFPKVVFAVPSEERKAVLVDLFAGQPTETWPLWQVVLAGDLVDVLIGGKP